jgi:two-component system, chemotaxis family, sensor kinase CheA
VTGAEDINDELTVLFRDEAAERLDQMDAALLAIEKGGAPASAVDELFRNAHTIKGGAGILGYDDIRSLAHAIEDVLALIRASGTFPPETAPPLLRATEALRAQVSGNGPAVAGLLDELATCASALATGGPAHGDPAQGGPAQGGPATGSPAIGDLASASPASGGLASADLEAGGAAAAEATAATAETATEPVGTAGTAATAPEPVGTAGTAATAPATAPAATIVPAVLTGIPDPRGAGQSEAGQRGTGQRGTDQRTAGESGGNQDAPDQRTADPRAADQRAVRVPAGKIDHLLDVVGEVMQERRRLIHSLGKEAPLTPDLADQLSAGDRMLGDLKDSAVGLRTLPLGAITGPLPRAVRDLARGVGKQVEFEVTGAGTELDRVILESLAEPLTHLLRNSVIHGIEPPGERDRAGKPPGGHIELRAIPRGRLVEIVVEDDGRGIRPEVIEQAHQSGSLGELLARPGYSTAREVTELAGRGVGLDAVKSKVQSLGGSFEVRSEPGRGMAVVLLLPLALALLDVLLFERGGAVFGVPLASVEEVVRAAPILTLEGKPALDIRGRPLPVGDVASLVGAPAPPLADGPPGLLLAASGRRVIVTCDELLGEQEVAVKPLGPLLSVTVGYLGAAILGDGRIALLLEPGALIRGFQAEAARPPPASPAAAPAKVLVVEDSFTVRELQRSILEAVGYHVITARDGLEALRALDQEDDIALVMSDFEMPGLDGLQLTRTIRASPAHSTLPVVIVTSRASEDDRRRGIEAGADAYMAKQGFDQHTLLATVERLIGRLPGDERPAGGAHAERADLRGLADLRGRAAPDARVRRRREGDRGVRHRRRGDRHPPAHPAGPGHDGHRTARDGRAHRGRADHERLAGPDPGAVRARGGGHRQGGRRARRRGA